MLLELLPSAENGLALQQLSQELGLRPSTVHNLVRTLEARGYVTKLSKPTRFALGPTVIDLAQQYMRRNLQRGAAKAVMAVFTHFRTGRAIYAECVAGEVVLRLRMTPERPSLLEQPWNSVMLPYVSASALVFQAYWRYQERQASSQHYPFAVYGASIWQTEERLDAFLAEVCEKGYAAPPVGQEALVPVAVPVFFSGDEIVGALGVAMPLAPKNGDTEERQRLIEKMQMDAAAYLRAQAGELNHIPHRQTVQTGEIS
jgi:IclR family transcriptional regulator, KDG regulon repressor